MEKEFNLSEKIEDIKYTNGMLPIQAIKEFIKIIQDEISWLRGWITEQQYQDVCETIKKRAGEKLR